MSNKPWEVEGKWCVSPHGFSHAVKAMSPYIRKNVMMREITFREGDDCVGLRVSVPDKMKLLEKAVEMGIKEVDNGGPSLHPHQWKFCRAIADSGLPVDSTARFFALTKDYIYDVDTCLEAGTSNFRVVMMQLSEDEVKRQMEKLPDIIDYIHKAGKTVGIALSDSVRAPIRLFDAAYDCALASGADNLNMPDTFGTACPPVMKYLSMRLRDKMSAIDRDDMDLVIHMHNTFGLATANSIACVEGGATQVDGACNGYGDEAGNASLEEIAVALEALYGVNTGLDLTMLGDYCKMYAELGRFPVQPHKAICGSNAFVRPMTIWHGHDMAHESWMTHEALCPEAVGVTDNIVFGPEASLDDNVIESKFEQLGVKDYTADDIVKMRRTVEAMLQEERTITLPTPYITEQEYDDLVRKMYNV